MPVAVVTAVPGGILVYTLDVVKQEPEWGRIIIIKDAKKTYSEQLSTKNYWRS